MTKVFFFPHFDFAQCKDAKSPNGIRARAAMGFSRRALRGGELHLAISNLVPAAGIEPAT